MNTKEIKAIAEIIKSTALHIEEREILSNSFADHFEREDNKNPNVKSGRIDKHFNREQFLKDCGVKE